MQNQMQKFILAVLVKNNANVLARVASLFGRRGFNIESLTVSTTTDPKISRMSIVVYGDEQTLEQILKQVSKLYETLWIEQLWEEESYCKELAFIKIHAPDASTRDLLRDIAAVYHANIVDAVNDALIVELTEVPSRIDAFLNVISSFDILEICRSGVTAIMK